MRFNSLYMVETLTAGITGFSASGFYEECQSKMGADFANFYVALCEQLCNTIEHGSGMELLVYETRNTLSYLRFFLKI